MLFNEPKLLKSNFVSSADRSGQSFSALQRAEIAEIQGRQHRAAYPARVSVLFNEPKLLKLKGVAFVNEIYQRFSALQRAENSSIEADTRDGRSAMRFSALQRAENSSIRVPRTGTTASRSFQCSSASRKFLNPDPRTCVHPYFRPR